MILNRTTRRKLKIERRAHARTLPASRSEDGRVQARTDIKHGVCVACGRRGLIISGSRVCIQVTETRKGTKYTRPDRCIDRAIKRELREEGLDETE